jgi:hypothetical protein
MMSFSLPCRDGFFGGSGVRGPLGFGGDHWHAFFTISAGLRLLHRGRWASCILEFCGMLVYDTFLGGSARLARRGPSWEFGERIQSRQTSPLLVCIATSVGACLCTIPLEEFYVLFLAFLEERNSGEDPAQAGSPGGGAGAIAGVFRARVHTPALGNEKGGWGFFWMGSG